MPDFHTCVQNKQCQDCPSSYHKTWKTVIAQYLFIKHMNDCLSGQVNDYAQFGDEKVKNCLGYQATLHKTLMVSFLSSRLLAAYNSLTDKHLTGYFNNTRIRRHLLRSGLVRFGLLSTCPLVSLNPVISSLFWFSF